MNTRIGKVFSFFMSKKVKRPISVILAFAMLITSITFSFPEETTYASDVPDGFTTIYFRDDTESGWIGNNNAVIQAVDNTNGHDYYIMKKEDSRTWSLRIRAKAYNFTFNRLSPDRKKQWNSWSAGGRGSNRNDYSTWKSTYHATVPEHGYWDGTPVVSYDYFKEGDVVYLDFYEFTDENGGYNWEKGNAVFYINFTEYSKNDNNGNDIKISSADKEKLVPIKLSDSPETQVFRYVVTKEDEGATELRFFRGNDEYLWNDSVVMKYSDYKVGNNCVKVKDWDNTGYVCPYVPRRHITKIDSVSIITTGNRKVNRKIDIDLDIQGEVEYLLMDETTLDINKIDSDGNIIATMDEVCLVDDSKTSDTHRELLFKESGTYKINAMVTDGYDEFPAEEIITIVDDEAPVAGFEMTAVEGEAVDDYKFVRNNQGQAHIKITDSSVAELGDYIIYKNYKLYHDANNDGNYEETEIIDTHDYDQDALNEISEDELSFAYELSNVGKYKIVLDIQEKFDDTILSLIDESVFLKGQIEKEFEIINKAPSSEMKIEKSKIADIIFTVGSAGSDELNDYAAESAKVKAYLKEQGIDARVTTVETSSLNATDTFAWKEYDHYNYKDRWLPTLDKHIIYDGKDIKMLGYSWAALKDFLYVEDNNANKKIFDFDLQRDRTDWHSMEGGGFLFNTVVNDEENYIQGYCVLVTQRGLKVVQINKTQLDTFRNTSSGNVERYGKCLKTYNIKNLYDNHHFRIIVDKNTITVYDDGELLVNEYVLPDDGIDAYGYGPIISHGSHNCSQQSYFTFKNITMQTVTGKSLSDVINEHEWLPGTNHYVINLSGEVIPELSEDGKTSDVAAALISNDVMFFGIGNDNSIDSYNKLLNIIDGYGENIQLTQKGEDEEVNEDDITVVKAVNQIVSRIENDVLSKDYKIYETITTDEPVEYFDTYLDPENDLVGTDEWKYEYDSSVFNEGNGTRDEFVTNEPVTLFENSGAYKITHIVSDDPTNGNENLSGYAEYADTDEYKKLILAHNRPVADMSVKLMQSKDGKKCLVNVTYESSDADHPSDSKKGIREEKFYYKELNENTWTQGRFPSEVEMGKIYLVKYVSKDIEGAYSRPCVRTINTNDARVYIKPEDNTPPSITLVVSKTLLEVGEELSVEAYAEDDNGVNDFVIKCNDEVVSRDYGRYIVTASEACTFNITVTATDLSGNTSSKSEEVKVIDNTDKIPPVIIIDSPHDGSISGDTDIVGTIKDNKALDSYTITKAKLNVETNEESDVEVVKTSNEEVIDDVIDTIDVDSLEEGYYKYTITAKDKAGLSSTVYMVITVRKEVKDTTPPECAIETISLDSDNNEVVITASVSDNENLAGYNLTLYRKDNEDSKTVIASGTDAIEHAEIASISTDDLTNGEYVLELYAWDGEDNSCISRGGFTYEAGSSEDVIIRDEDITPPVVAGNIKASTDDKGLHITLNGSITDDNLKVYEVTTGKKNEDGVVENEISVTTGNTSITDSDIASYTYSEIVPGDYVVYVTAEDEAGNLTKASYVVTVTQNGTIEDVNNNGGGGGSDNNDDDKYYGDLNLTLSSTSTDAGNVVYGYITYPKNAKNVSVTTDKGEVSLNGRVATIMYTQAGLVTVTLSAEIDGENKQIEKSIRYYDRNDKNAPYVEIISPEPDSDLGIKTDIVGTVKDEEGLAYYVLEYKLNGTDNYIELAKGYENVENITLATLDKTLLMNGSYSIRLSAVDNGGNIVRTERSVNVSGDLKVGNMSIGFTDINTNVSGIPLSVTRNYDSRNKASGDFGTGWTLGLNSVKLTESHDIATGYEMAQSGTAFSTKYEMVETYSHDITVSYGDGTSDRFKVSFSPQRRALVPIYDVSLNFVCVTNKKVKLQLEGSNYALVYSNFLLFDDIEMSENHSYILTKEDGTKLYISPKYGLTKAVDTNGNTITISKNGFKHSNGMGIDFTRDKNGRITKATEKDKDGNEIDYMSYVYDEDDNLIMNIDKAGRSVTYTYDNNHNLIDIIDPSGIAIARNEYDDEGRLVATIDADGNRTEFEHDIDSKTEVIRDRKGNPTVYTYDDNGNVLKTVDALGNITTNTYDANNNKLSSTDANGNTTYFEYDSDNRLKSLTTAEGTVEELTYNELNIVTDIKFAGKDIASMNYDSKGNLTKAEDSLGNSTDFTYEKDGKLSSVADEIGTVHKLKYDTDGNLVSMEDGNGNTTKYDYDENGRCVAVTVARTNEDGSKSEYTSRYVYDNAGNVISEISNSGIVTTYEYDYRNNMTAQITADGIRTNYEYDNQSNLTKITYSDGTFEEFTYDKNGNNITAKDRMGVTVTMTYDKIDRLIKKTFADGSSENYKYDANGNVISVTNVEGGVIKYSYDSMNRNTQIEDAYGNISTFEYNERSLLTKFTDASGNVFEYEYDANGNQTGLIYPDGTKEQLVYDARNRVVKKIDRENHETSYIYNDVDLLTEVVDACGNSYKYEYDETNELVKVTDANGNETRYVYNADGRVTKAVNALGKTAEYTYDSYGKVVGYKDYKGNQNTYVYDANGNLTRMSCNDGSTNFTYDEFGRLSKVNDNHGEIVYAYDEFGRLASKKTYNLGVTKYTYTSSDDIKTVTHNVNGVDVATTTYDYDLMDRVVKVVAHDGVATLYEYDAIGNRTLVKHEGGLSVRYTYDVCSRMINQVVTDKDSNVLMYYDYSYGTAGERTKTVEVVRNSADDNQARIICNQYEYDELLRLTKEVISIKENVAFDDVITLDGENVTLADFDEFAGSITNEYEYDSVSNRTSKNTVIAGDVDGYADEIKEGTTSYTYNELNQLLSARTAEDEVINYSYDDNGNLISESGSITKAYTYSSQNKLLTATISEGNNVTIESYEYDFEGNRISKQTGEEDKVYYLNDTYDELTQVALELKKGYDSNGNELLNVSKYYTRGTELLSADIVETNDAGEDIVDKKLYIQDVHGSVTALAQNTSEDTVVICDTYTYDAYGNLLKKTGNTDNDYLYTGEQYNESTGLYYLRARYMNPQTGTFTTMDSYAGTLDNPVSLHKYLYANANPVMNTDPSGYFSLAECSVAQSMNNILSATRAYLDIKRIMSWVNIGLTAYDVGVQIRAVLCGQASIVDVAVAFAKGMVTQALISCFAKALLGEAASMLLKMFGVVSDVDELIEAIQAKDPEKIVIAALRIALDIFTFSCQCFTEDTLVETTDGSKKISDIEAGDVIYAYNTQTGENEECVVKDVSVTKTDTLVHVRLSDGSEIKTTMYHPFFVENGKDEDWVVASNLEKGDRLHTIDERELFVEEVIVEKLSERIEVYNLEIDGLHTYYAGCVLVHNDCNNSGNSDKKANVEGRTVYMEDSLFDPQRVDKRGRTNIQRMEQGLAPIGSDGKSVNLHHMDQTDNGPIMEILASIHQRDYKKLHSNTGQSPSKIDRKLWNKFRRTYWKWRAAHLG